jgi:hypothetical protein
VVLPGNEYRSDLPKLEKREKPVGYHAGLQIEERLQGLGAILLGAIGLTVSWLIFTGALTVGLPPPPPPPGVMVQVPVMNPTQCIAPLMAVGGISLIVVGFRRTIDP